MAYYIVHSPFSSSLGSVAVTQGTYLDPDVAESEIYHASGYDAAALDLGLSIDTSVLSMADGVIVDVHDAHAADSSGTHGFGNYVTFAQGCADR